MNFFGEILLISPSFFGYEKNIKAEVEAQIGREVIWFDTRPKNDFFTKLFMRIGALYLIKKRVKKHQGKILGTVQERQIDTIIFINPEGFSNDFFSHVKKNSPNTNMILYLWDSIENKPLIKPLLQNFNKIFSFDNNDCHNYGFNFLPLFFSNNYYKKNRMKNPTIDITFIGTVHSQRMQVIKQVAKLSKEKGLIFYHYLFIQNWIIFFARKLADKNFKGVSGFRFHFSPLSSNEIKKVYANTKAILDIEHGRQRGLTMRTFETLGSGLKLITTNKDIKNYDIYNPNNVFIIDKENVEIDENFLTTPFNDYPDDIIGKYSLSSWVKTIIFSQKESRNDG